MTTMLCIGTTASIGQHVVDIAVSKGTDRSKRNAGCIPRNQSTKENRGTETFSIPRFGRCAGAQPHVTTGFTVPMQVRVACKTARNQSVSGGVCWDDRQKARLQRDLPGPHRARPRNLCRSACHSRNARSSPRRSRLPRAWRDYGAHSPRISEPLRRGRAFRDRLRGGVGGRRPARAEPHSAQRSGCVKLKLDENIPQSAAARLAALGYDVDTVLDEQLGGRSDEDVWAAAQAEGRLLVTHDLDFADTRKFEPGQHAGVLIVRLPDSEQWRVGDHLVGWFSDPDARTWERCMVIATPRKVRVVRGATTQR